MEISVNLIYDFRSSTYHAVRYDDVTFFVAGSSWERRNVLKNPTFQSAQGVLYCFHHDEVTSLIMDTDMLYTTEVIEKNLLFVGGKTERNAFQLLDIPSQKVIRQQPDLVGGGCYCSLYLPAEKEVLVTTRKGFLQTIDANTLSVKNSIQLAPIGTRLWAVHYDPKESIVYASDYEGSLHVIQKEGYKMLNKISLSELYHHRDNHDNLPSLWGLSYQNGCLIGGDRFGGITIWDRDFKIQNHYRLLRNGSLITDPAVRMLSSEVESVMSLAMIDDQHFIFGSRWGNVFLGDLQGNIQKILSVPMGVQKENSAFSMERIDSAYGVEVLVTFGDGQVYSLTYSKLTTQP